MAKKTWMGKWDTKKDREPDKKNEVAFKEYLIAKYERKSWYRSPAEIKREAEQQVTPTADQAKLPPPTTSVKVPLFHMVMYMCVCVCVCGPSLHPCTIWVTGSVCAFMYVICVFVCTYMYMYMSDWPCYLCLAGSFNKWIVNFQFGCVCAGEVIKRTIIL